LPFGWEKQVNSEGKIFYVDHINHRTTYADPRLAFAVEEKEHPGDFRQRFDASSTAMQVLHGRDLSSKVAIITGANCGIG
jgi:WW domain-containing oxidoreductase